MTLKIEKDTSHASPSPLKSRSSSGPMLGFAMAANVSLDGAVPSAPMWGMAGLSMAALWSSTFFGVLMTAAAIVFASAAVYARQGKRRQNDGEPFAAPQKFLAAKSQEDLGKPAVALAKAWLLRARAQRTGASEAAAMPAATATTPPGRSSAARKPGGKLLEDSKGSRSQHEVDGGLTTDGLTDGQAHSDSGCDTVWDIVPRRLEVTLQRREDETWGIGWNVGAQSRRRLVIANIRPDSPAANCVAADGQSSVPSLLRGDRLVRANGVAGFAAIEQELSSATTVQLCFMRTDYLSPTAAGAAACGDLPKTASLPAVSFADEVSLDLPRSSTVSGASVVPNLPGKLNCRVKNSFIEVAYRSDECSAVEDDRGTQSEPALSRSDLCEKPLARPVASPAAARRAAHAAPAAPAPAAVCGSPVSSESEQVGPLHSSRMGSRRRPSAIKTPTSSDVDQVSDLDTVRRSRRFAHVPQTPSPTSTPLMTAMATPSPVVGAMPWMFGATGPLAMPANYYMPPLPGSTDAMSAMATTTMQPSAMVGGWEMPLSAGDLSTAHAGYSSQAAPFDGVLGSQLSVQGLEAHLVGQKAVIAGLVRVPEYNGQWCMIEAYDEDLERYAVRVISEDGGADGPVTAKVKLDNLIIPSDVVQHLQALYYNMWYASPEGMSFAPSTNQALPEFPFAPLSTIPTEDGQNIYTLTATAQDAGAGPADDGDVDAGHGAAMQQAPGSSGAQEEDAAGASERLGSDCAQQEERVEDAVQANGAHPEAVVARAVPPVDAAPAASRVALPLDDLVPPADPAYARPLQARRPSDPVASAPAPLLLDSLVPPGPSGLASGSAAVAHALSGSSAAAGSQQWPTGSHEPADGVAIASLSSEGPVVSQERGLQGSQSRDSPRERQESGTRTPPRPERDKERGRPVHILTRPKEAKASAPPAASAAPAAADAGRNLLLRAVRETSGRPQRPHAQPPERGVPVEESVQSLAPRCAAVGAGAAAVPPASSSQGALDVALSVVGASASAAAAAPEGPAAAAAAAGPGDSPWRPSLKRLNAPPGPVADVASSRQPIASTSEAAGAVVAEAAGQKQNSSSAKKPVNIPEKSVLISSMAPPPAAPSAAAKSSGVNISSAAAVVGTGLKAPTSQTSGSSSFSSVNKARGKAARSQEAAGRAPPEDDDWWYDPPVKPMVRLPPPEAAETMQSSSGQAAAVPKTSWRPTLRLG
eukprot:TRINITY_DN41611_c0_g1_i1.p1 TRINITY_DN41611_c0_g1~~TRINITY_DN41611_c0_g1_i1.p1  ORF type:complete len:1212 (-),score=226.28 TRINITY_DN41611_c0_g1_i1:68-3703(-)